jgi:hypothetical protein
LTRKDGWFQWEPLENSGFEAIVLCWDTGMMKRKLDNSLVLMDGRKLGESNEYIIIRVTLPYGQAYGQ